VHEIGCDPVSGVDIAESCWEQSWVKDFLRQGHQHIVIQDCSHTALPFDDDTYDFAFCTETIEHLSNPFFMVSEVKRVLKHNGIFVLAFPMPEDNLGYDGGEHAHIYPGFLLQEPFELFMKQLYFKIRHHRKNGSSAWYTFQSYKQRGVVSAFDMGHSNYTEAELFKCLEDF
jgi:ubiquinone/menaquinone biosynthesis C-methylase UbiE